MCSVSGTRSFDKPWDLNGMRLNWKSSGAVLVSTLPHQDAMQLPWRRRKFEHRPPW